MRAKLYSMRSTVGTARARQPFAAGRGRRARDAASKTHTIVQSSNTVGVNVSISNGKELVAVQAERATPHRPADSEDEASFFIRNLRALPWQRASVWLVVVSVAVQLSDFFGVRSRM